MTASPRRLVWTPLTAISPADLNPKRHDLTHIAASIDRFGFLEPVVVDSRTGRLVSGHGRVEALAALSQRGGPPPHGVTVKAGVWCVPTVEGWESADDHTASAALVAVNRAPERGGWDDDLLAGLMAELDDDLIEVAGFDPDDYRLDDTVVFPTKPERVQTPAVPFKGDEDDAPDTPEEPDTQPGDLWLLGTHRLLCGDATQVADVDRLFDGTKPELLLTDPPYCSGGFQEVNRPVGSVGTTAPHKQVANDRLSTRGYMALMKAMLGLAPCPFVYMFTDWKMWVNLFDAVESSGFGVRSMIVWDKGNPGMGQGWRAQHEIVMWAAKRAPKFDGHKASGNVVQASRTGNPLHTTQKPVDLLARLLTVADFATSVYDPFAGSGSTIIAGEHMGRTVYAMELDAAYCDVTVKRWETYTGRKAERVS